MRIPTKVLWPNFAKRGGLITVVAIETGTAEVLMLASTNEECFQQTLETALATYFSTSRNEKWVKGQTSGNTQKVTGIEVDCDGDAVIYYVEPQGDGVACHTGAKSCFYRSVIVSDNGENPEGATEKEELSIREVAVDESLLQ